MRLLIAFFACVLALGCQAKENSERLKAARFDDTDLCFPASYSPDLSYMNAYLAPIADQLDSSEGQELIYIPAQVIKTLVPEYTESHVNSNGVDYAHDLRGIAYSLSSIGNPNGLAEKAWNANASPDNSLVEPDPTFPFTRIYPFSEPTFMWSLVKTEPPENPTGVPPKDWYIGSCSESAGDFVCRQTVTFESVFYEYKLQRHDLHLREKVQDAVENLLEEWQHDCRRE